VLNQLGFGGEVETTRNLYLTYLQRVRRGFDLYIIYGLPNANRTPRIGLLSKSLHLWICEVSLPSLTTHVKWSSGYNLETGRMHLMGKED